MATPKKKETDYRSGSALLKKQLAARSGKPVVLPSKKNVVNAAKQIGGAALTVAGPGKIVKVAKAVKAVQAASKAKKADNVAKAMLKRKSEYANVDRSVKTIYNGNTPERVSKEFKVDYNRLSDKAVNEAKSGRAAKADAARIEKYNAESGRNSTFRKKVSENVTVKIKAKPSDKVKKDMAELAKINGRKTIPGVTKAKVKAETRALKAANKKK
jgi:hypothetical protein